MSGQSNEIQARLNIVCQDLIAFFVESGVPQRTVTLLTEKMESHNTEEVIDFSIVIIYCTKSFCCSF